MKRHSFCLRLLTAASAFIFFNLVGCVGIPSNDSVTVSGLLSGEEIMEIMSQLTSEDLFELLNETLLEYYESCDVIMIVETGSEDEDMNGRGGNIEIYAPASLNAEEINNIFLYVMSEMGDAAASDDETVEDVSDSDDAETQDAEGLVYELAGQAVRKGS